jgi:hypothetical protein
MRIIQLSQGSHLCLTAAQAMLAVQHHLPAQICESSAGLQICNSGRQLYVMAVTGGHIGHEQHGQKNKKTQNGDGNWEMFHGIIPHCYSLLYIGLQSDGFPDASNYKLNFNRVYFLILM